MHGPFDKQIELRDVNSGAVTVTTAETGIAYSVLMAGDFKCVFHVTAVDTVDTDETYMLSVEVDSLASFTDSPVEVGRVALNETGRYIIPLAQEQIAKLDPDAAAIRVVATLGGTSPSITYGCYLAP